MADLDKDRSPTGRPSPPGATADTGGRSNAGHQSADTNAARQAAEETKRAAQDIAGRAKEQGRSTLDRQKHTAAEQVDSVAHAFRSAASKLQEEDQSGAAGQYVASAAERLESFAQQLRHKDLDTMLRDVEDLGRRSPATLFAGSLAAGFLLARFLKSSRQSPHASSGMGMEDDRSSYAGSDMATGGAYYGEYATEEWSGSDESSASELGLAGSVLPDAAASGSPSTTVRGDSASARGEVGADGTPASSPNDTRPGGTNYGNR